MHQAPRLALIIPSLVAGGAERVLSVLANEWVRRGHEVVLITLTPTEEDFYPVDRAVDRVGLDLAVRPRGTRWLTVNAARIRRLRHLIASSKADVVVSFLDEANLLALIATRGLGIPVAVSVRTNPTAHYLKPTHRALRRALYPRASAVVVQTQDAGAWASRFVPAGKVFVIPNPASPPPEVEPTEPELNIAAVGRLVEQKGFDVLIGAFALCAASQPEWTVTIAGAGPELPNLVEQARLLGVGERVRFPGLTTKPYALFSRSSLFVLSSRHEGFPMVLLEAMASGLPVIATDCRFGPRTIVRDGIDGILVPPDDRESLGAAMARLMADPEERSRLAERAPSVLERFSLSSVAERWDELFAAIAGRP